MRLGRLSWVLVVLSAMGMLSCTEQHQQEDHKKAIKAERMAANQPIKRLTAEGKLPKISGQKAVATSGNAKYDTLCASCHGIDGKADTPAGKAMNPRPRNFATADFTSDDARIRKVIKEGGASVGLSASMAPWGAMLSDAELDEMVKTVKSFKK